MRHAPGTTIIARTLLLSTLFAASLALQAHAKGGSLTRISSTEQMGPEDDAREARAARLLKRLGRERDEASAEEEPSAPVITSSGAALEAIDPELVDWYAKRLRYLSDPAREGRAPGTDGIEHAADFLQVEFVTMGLKPAFGGGSSFRQPMEMGVSLDPVREEMSLNGRALTPGKDFEPLAYSGSTSVRAGVAFTGYAIRSGPDGYRGFEDVRDLEGAVALCLKYEPMDQDGASLWRDNGWSNRSRLTYKVNELVNRGAGAVLIVSPSIADDERAGVMDNLNSTSPPPVSFGVDASPSFDIPVCAVSEEVARAIIGAGDHGHTLESLMARANEGGVVEFFEGADVEIDIELERAPTMTDNLGALLEGRGVLKDEYVVIGAHYDHVGYGRFGSRWKNAAGIIHPGADDNGSGTTGLLVTAQALAEMYEGLDETQSARSVLFLLFTAEESGLNGSRYYVENPIAPIERHELMLNLDMIGSLENDPLEIGSLDSSEALARLVIENLDESGIVYAQDVSVGRGRSDHASFDAADIPNIFFFTGLHERYHTPDDTFEFVDTEGAVRVALIVADIAFDAALDKEGFEHTDDGAPQEDEGNAAPKVRIGIVPSNGSDGGMVILRVFDNTSASDAGLVPGDIITHWDGDAIGSVESWSPRLLDYEPGDVVKLKVTRDGKTLEMEMTLKGA